MNLRFNLKRKLHLGAMSFTVMAVISHLSDTVLADTLVDIQVQASSRPTVLYHPLLLLMISGLIFVSIVVAIFINERAKYRSKRPY